MTDLKAALIILTVLGALLAGVVIESRLGGSSLGQAIAQGLK